MRTKVAHNAFLRDPDDEAAAGLREEEIDSLLTDSDEDAGLQEVREQRLRQLHQEKVLREAAAMCGTGTLQDVPEQELLRVIREASSAVVVCHIIKNSTEADAQLDEVLTTLAHQFRGVVFLRTPLSGYRAPVVTQLGIPCESGLICFRNGGLSSTAPLESLGSGGDIYEEKVLGFLKRCGALRKALIGKRQQEKLDSESEGEEMDWQDPCAVCGRRYYHEHVRSISKGNVHCEDADTDDM
ncbi:g9354 [Coccomyxa elongata]